MRIICSILVMAVVTYLIRMLPMTIFRKKIQSRFLQDFLYYIPYAILSAMTIPAVFYATGDFPSAIAATVIAVVLAWNGLPLIVVALAASGTALLVSLIEQWIWKHRTNQHPFRANGCCFCDFLSSINLVVQCRSHLQNRRLCDFFRQFIAVRSRYEIQFVQLVGIDQKGNRNSLGFAGL